MMDSIFNWFRSLWSDLAAFIGRIFINILDMFMDGITAVLSLIPMPEFMTQYSIGLLMGPVEPYIGYFLQQSQVGTALQILGAAYVASFIKNAIPIIGR